MKSLNLLRIVALASLAALISPASFAQVNGTVTVNVNLTSKCRFISGATIDFGTYVAFQSADVTPAAQDVKFECTRGYSTIASPSFSWDTTNGDATGNGVIAGLAYNLTAALGSRVTGSAPTATAGAGADTATIKVTGFMAGLQPGDGNGGAATKTRTLTVTF